MTVSTFLLLLYRVFQRIFRCNWLFDVANFFCFDFLKYYLYCVVFFEIFVKITYYGFLFSGGSPQTKAISIQSKWGCILGGDLLKQQKWSLFRFRYESRCNGIEHNLYICSPCGPCFGNYYWKMDFLNNNITSFYVKSLSADNQKIQMI